VINVVTKASSDVIRSHERRAEFVSRETNTSLFNYRIKAGVRMLPPALMLIPAWILVLPMILVLASELVEAQSLKE